ncbi:lipocalin family protein [Pedobacter insulae]|uniref:Lipocalin-like domain-containing protein n=1 Tax=Pedobacter insulae TaxID=414048 RepID=A0A1I2WMM4_9SPHI|nr:lipocalin family protein [Pedobacter insulae]SFH02628.1 Lipocalin-like domain-containing protein [Pedobacter insulae]
MKRIFLIASLALGLLITLDSCSPKTTSGTVAVKRGDVSGNWILSNVSFENIPEIAVKSFLGENSYACFIGSTWSLTNSGNGKYELPANSTCGAKTQNIFWSVSTADETFQFKKVNEGEKPKNITDGYRLMLSSADDNNMVIKSPIEYGSGSAYVVLNFTKAVR